MQCDDDEGGNVVADSDAGGGVEDAHPDVN